MLKQDGEELVGNEKYEGFAIDLLQELSHIMDFNFILTPIPFSKGSTPTNTPHNQWNQVIQQVQQKV